MGVTVTPIGSSSLHSPAEILVAAGGFAALLTGRVPPIVVVAVTALIAQVASFT